MGHSMLTILPDLLKFVYCLLQLARIEWQEVMDVVDALHEIDDEIEKRDTEVGGSSDEVLKILSESYNHANKRAKVSKKMRQYMIIRLFALFIYFFQLKG